MWTVGNPPLVAKFVPDTVIDVPPADGPEDGVTDEIVRGPAAWFTVKAWPPTVKMPERATPGFAETLYVTVPLPLPVDWFTTVIQSIDGKADHEQPF